MNWVQIGISGLLMTIAAVAQPKQAFDLSQSALDAMERGNFAEAEKLNRQSIAMWQTLGPGYEAHLGTTDSNLGQTLAAQGKRREAVEAFKESLALLRRSMGIKNERTLTTLNLLGGVDLLLGDFDAAEKLFDEALPIEREFFADNVQLARTLGGMAAVRLQAADYDGALKFAEEGLDLSIRTEGEESLDAALSYANVAEIHRAAGRRDRALPLFRKARAIYEKNLGPTHVRVASMLGQEGLILAEDGKLSTAEQLLKRALDVINQACPGCTLERYVAETNLSLVRIRQRRYADADRLLTDTLAIAERYWKTPGPDLVSTLKALAFVREKEHRNEEAQRLSERASLIQGFR